MKSIANNLQRDSFVSFKVILASITCLLFLITPSCEKDVTINSEITSEYLLNGVLVVYLDNTQTFRYKGKPGVTIIPIGKENLSEFEDCFVLYVSSGANSATAVSSAIIKLDGQEVLNASDFSKKNLQFTFEICNLTEQSVITVEVKGEPGSYIDIWIEGSLKVIITPTFDQIGPICQNSTPPSLPESSTNDPEITGTWVPASINTSETGIRTYTFTPDEGQNATETTMNIEVLSPVIPLFTQIGPLYQNTIPPVLPATSENGINGTWSPTSINTSETGKTAYTFTPAEDQCASNVTMEIEIICHVTDVDGNSYKTVTIGTQIWMAENLKTTKYNNGLDITLEEGNIFWTNLDKGGYCWYGNKKELYGDIYGALYNWYAVNTNVLCPTGWHVPTNEEWHQLVLFLDPTAEMAIGEESIIAGGALKEDGYDHWSFPNTDATNSSGFTARGGGWRVYGSYSGLTTICSFWSADEYEDENGDRYSAIVRKLANNDAKVLIDDDFKTYGASVRCIKDSE